MSKPKWVNPVRQAHLVHLFETYGNRCLQGHSLCPEPTHYIYNRTIPLIAPIPTEPTKCSDTDGNPLFDRDGNRLLATGYDMKISRVIIPEVSRLYDRVIDKLVKDWIEDDRQARVYQRRLEMLRLHRLPEKGSIRGRFNAISRTIFYDTQPSFYMEALGISGLTFKPFAKVRISSSHTRLHVDISEPLGKVSKNRKRKAVRYCKALPVDTQTEVDHLCSMAVKHYMNL